MKTTSLSKLKVGHIIQCSAVKGKWVVIESINERCAGPHSEPNFNAWRIVIQKLKRDGTHDYKNKKKTFYDCSIFGDQWVNEVEIVGKMKKSVVYVEEIKVLKKKTLRFK